MTGTRVAKTFGVDEAYVGTYNAGGAATFVQFPIVQDSTLELTYERAEVLDGMGRRQGIWIHSPSGRVTLRGGEASMRIMEMVSGSGVSSYASVDRIQFGTADELTPPTVRLKLRWLRLCLLLQGDRADAQYRYGSERPWRCGDTV